VIAPRFIARATPEMTDPSNKRVTITKH